MNDLHHHGHHNHEEHEHQHCCCHDENTGHEHNHGSDEAMAESEKNHIHHHEHGAHDHCCCGHDDDCHEHGEHSHEHGCCCHDDGLHCCCHDEDEDRGKTVRKILTAAVLFAAALMAEHLPSVKNVLLQFGTDGFVYRAVCAVLYLAAYLVCGKNVLKESVAHIRKGKIFDEQFLMSVASIGAVFVGEYAEAVAVMLFYMVGEFFQDYAVDKSKDSISALMDIRPDYAVVIRDGQEQKVSPESVNTGELIEIKPGERVPLDGVIESGKAFVDTSALTGESVPRELFEGNEVLAGFINTSGVIKVRVTKPYGESAVTRILELTQKAGAAKARSERFITRFAAVYTPAVCIAAVAVAVLPPLFLNIFMPELFAEYGWSTWIYRALTFLVVSCPCALVISVPLTFFSGIGAASSKGILVKGGNFIEILAKVRTVVFDKTGTLTKGVFSVSKVEPAIDGMSAEELIAIATHAEYYSNHPISKSLKAFHCAECCKNINITDAQEISGQGIIVRLDGRTVLAGNSKLMESHGVEGFSESGSENGTVIHIAVDGKYNGFIVISDEIKDDAGKAVKELKKLNVNKTVMLTGDSENSAKYVAEKLGMDEYYSRLLPEDKVNKIEQLIGREKVMFVGDGINDSPVLARSDVGVAMGALGSDAAIESADVVIMDDNLTHLADVIKISRKTMLVVNENIWLSLIVKFGIMIFGMIGLANIWIAVFGDVGVCLIAVFNALRLLSFTRKSEK